MSRKSITGGVEPADPHRIQLTFDAVGHEGPSGAESFWAGVSDRYLTPLYRSIERLLSS